MVEEDYSFFSRGNSKKKIRYFLFLFYYNNYNIFELFLYVEY